MRSATDFDKKKLKKLVRVNGQAYLELYVWQMVEGETITPPGATVGNEEDLLFFTLFSLKSGLRYDLLGLVTGMEASNAQRNQEMGLEVLKKTLEDGSYAPKREFSSKGHFIVTVSNTAPSFLMLPSNLVIVNSCKSSTVAKKSPHRKGTYHGYQGLMDRLRQPSLRRQYTRF